ncbi:hyaluronan mediated motility receptor-like protein [Thalictrum thalictroides]|uniref:Hyaluronan mediated motility receptor-like protein n=1 Tax=Thalictrum thalictroides TaxID=46969 RepID=A0A7J6WBZ0_THATH|nr:hyaluronan mediated motility receptor-like protein [Thalictrum thalictroides]
MCVYYYRALIGLCETCFQNMSRPMVLVFLLVVLIITSQFEWKQQLVSDQENRSDSQKTEHVSQREEVVKEKIILSQERNIQKLNELVRNLRQQLLQCKGNNDSAYGTTNFLSESTMELEQQPILED